MHSNLHLLPVACLAAGAVLAFLPTGHAAQGAWQKMANLHFAEARAGFEAEEGERARLGGALALLGAQPKTDANLDEAERRFAVLAAEAVDPEVRARAAYFHARVPHVHRRPGDWAEAARRYLEVYRAQPGHPLGQRAYVRHGLVTLFRPMPPSRLEEEMARFVEGAAGLDDADAVRDFEWLLVALHERRLREPAGTLRHLERLIGGDFALGEANRLSFLVQAGELARELGQAEKAAGFYRAFLATARRDARVYLIRERLAEVEAAR